MKISTNFVFQREKEKKDEGKLFEIIATADYICGLRRVHSEKLNSSCGFYNGKYNWKNSFGFMNLMEEISMDEKITFERRLKDFSYSGQVYSVGKQKL